MSMRGARTKIRPPRRGGLTGDQVNFDETWQVLAESLTQIHERNASTLSFEELYRTAYKLVLKKYGEKLYNNVKDLVARHLKHVAATQIKPLRPGAVVGNNTGFGSAAIERRDVGNKFLVGVKDAWEEHQTCMGMITDVLMYMDRVYCTDNKKPSIHVACTALFRSHILRNTEYNIGKDLNSVILDQIKMERDGDVINRATIKACVYMLEGLYETEAENESEKVYLTSFEEHFLQTSDEFYLLEAQRLLRECDAATYVKRAERRLIEERERCQSTISNLTQSKIQDVVEKRLISDTIKDVMELESGLNFMMDNDKLDDIELLFRLIKRVDSNTHELKRMIRLRIVELGADINKGISSTTSGAAASTTNTATEANGDGGASEDKAVNNETLLAIKWVEDVLALKDKYDKIWQKSMASDQGIQQTISKAFAEFINNNRKSSEYISLFVDENIKKGLKGKTEAEVDVVLDKAIVLFRYIQDKDVFERYYKKHLSKRLILGRSISTDVERAMISKIKVEVGYSFTTKMEGMFKDMNVSNDLTSEYKRYVANLGDPDTTIDLEIKVLTATFWPWSSMGNEQVHTCTFPQELERVKSSFQKYYLGRHSGRQLTWQPQMGTGDLRATFKGRKHELNVSTYAMVILLIFNDETVTSLTFEEIRVATSIPESELIRQLQSLAVAPKTRVLIKSPMSRDIKPTDRFSYNANFTSKALKIKIGVVKGGGNKVETDKERKETDEKIDESRGHVIEAAIVRTMKSRNVLKHQDLILQITEQLSKRFMPEPAMIKKRIESLIEREYLERHADDPNTYVYMA